MGKDPFLIGKIPPTPVLVNQYFNDSTGVGDEGEKNARGPWNEGGDWEFGEQPELEQGVENLESAHSGNGNVGQTRAKGAEAESRGRNKTRKLG